MKKQWIYLNNQFLFATKDSYRSMQKIGDYTLYALNAAITDSTNNAPGDVAFFTSLRDRLQPLVVDFRNKYAGWGTQQGAQKGQTSLLAEKLAILRSEKIEAWDLTIQSVYRRSSSQYQGLLPHFRAPFQKGSQQDRISAVRSLHTAVSTDNTLPTSLKTDIEAFLSSFETTLKDSGIKKNKTLALSDSVEASRVVLCENLFGIMALLMNHYCSKPAMVERFFDLETIRNHEQSEFRHRVKAGQTIMVMTHHFEAGDELRLINDGDTELCFFLAAQKSDGPGTLTVTVQPGKEERVKIGQLGDVTHRFLKAQNRDAEKDGHYMVVLV